MELKVRIIEIFPKIQTIKNNQKDVISISFETNDYFRKIENIEESIIKNEKIIINLKDQNVKKNKIKCLLFRNNNDIIASGEVNLEEGLNWYKLNIAKSNIISKESLITSSTSNGNIQNINSNHKNSYFGANSPNSLDTNISIENNHYFSPKNNNQSKTQYIKLKLMIVYLKRKNISFKKKIVNSTNEQSENSSKVKESFFEKGNDYFECSLNDMEIYKINPKAKLFTTDKKNNKIRQSILFGNQQTKSPKKKINFNITNKNSLATIASGDHIILNNNKDISYAMNDNNFQKSSNKKIEQIIKNKKTINEDNKNWTSSNFYRKKNISDNKYSFEKKIINKKIFKSEKNHHKLNSCENFEEKLIDQNFKNCLKNDENLKSNLSRNDSYNSLANTDKQNDVLDTKKMEQELYDRDTYDDNNENKNEELNYQSQNTKIYNIIESEIDNKNENYERLKIDFLLLYSDDNIKIINNEDLFLEMQFMVEKLLKLQHIHQKEYNHLFKSINVNTKIVRNYQKLYTLLFKKMSKLNLKKLEDSMKTKKELSNETASNLIKVRKKIIKDSEFSIWNKLMKNSNKSFIIEKTKNKMVNIFLNICSRKENKLNKLSFKFYNEIKEKQNKKSNKKIENTKKCKYKNLANKKVISIETKINTNIKETNNFLYKTSKKFYSNKYNLPSSKGKNNKIAKKNSSIKIMNNKNNNKYGTIVNETTNNFHKKIRAKK